MFYLEYYNSETNALAAVIIRTKLRHYLLCVAKILSRSVYEYIYLQHNLESYCIKCLYATV